jgi:hypothetical protein
MALKYNTLKKNWLKSPIKEIRIRPFRSTFSNFLLVKKIKENKMIKANTILHNTIAWTDN